MEAQTWMLVSEEGEREKRFVTIRCTENFKASPRPQDSQTSEASYLPCREGRDDFPRPDPVSTAGTWERLCPYHTLRVLLLDQVPASKTSIPVLIIMVIEASGLLLLPSLRPRRYSSSRATTTSQQKVAIGQAPASWAGRVPSSKLQEDLASTCSSKHFHIYRHEPESHRERERHIRPRNHRLRTVHHPHPPSQPLPRHR